MDPRSIAAASASLVGSCLTISNYIYTFVNNSELVDTAVRLLGIEIDSLQKVLASISSSFNDPLIAKVAFETQNDHEIQHGKNVKRSMDDCKETLKRLEEIWKGVSGSSPHFVGPPRNAIKVESEMSEIALLKEQIVAYRRTMHLSLQVFTVYVFPIHNPGANGSAYILHTQEIPDTIHSRLEGMSADIRQLLQLFSNRPHRPHRESSRILINLEECVRSAKICVDAASTIVNSRSTVKGSRDSVFPQDIDDIRKTLLDKWIAESHSAIGDQKDAIPESPTSTKIVSGPIGMQSYGIHPEQEAIPEITSDGTTLSISRYDVKLKLLETWRLSAHEKYKAHEYNEAKKILEKLLPRSKEKLGASFDGRDLLTKMLGMCYCWLEEWDNAEKILKDQFDGREKVVEILAISYLRQGKFDAAEKLVLSTIRDESFGQNQSELMSILAEVYLAKNKFEDALVWAERVCDERGDSVGSESVLLFLSLNLLARICEAREDMIEAQGYRSLLPPGIQGALFYLNIWQPKS